MNKSKYKVILYRGHKDFKFGTWRHEHHNDGGLTVLGRLKKNDCVSKYMDIVKV